MWPEVTGLRSVECGAHNTAGERVMHDAASQDSTPPRLWLFIVGPDARVV